MSMNYSKIATIAAGLLAWESCLGSAEAAVISVTLSEAGYAAKTFTSADPGALFSLSDYAYGSYSEISFSAIDADYGSGGPDLVSSISSLQGKSGISSKDKLTITVRETLTGSYDSDEVTFAGGARLANRWGLNEAASFWQGRADRASASARFLGNRADHAVARGSAGPATLNFSSGEDRLTAFTERFTIRPKAYAAGTDVSGAEITSNVTDVPEPSTWALMFLGFVGVGCFGMRRRLAAFSS
jgi:hypothetical protein